jgi:hypothetical protein
MARLSIVQPNLDLAVRSQWMRFVSSSNKMRVTVRRTDLYFMNPQLPTCSIISFPSCDEIANILIRLKCDMWVPEGQGF